jgi:DnaJ-class molecular chaperone
VNDVTNEETGTAHSQLFPFQVVADAYYVLSDPIRRREYDALLASRAYSERTSTDPDASSNFFSSFANMFTSAGTSSGNNTQQPEEKQEEPFGERPDADETFANVFEEVSPSLKA